MTSNAFPSFSISQEFILLITFPAICSSLVIFFKQLRRRFPIQVNCWFCNSNTSLPYNERNSFTCPTCEQYNGFTEDGDYNKVIPEQLDELLNHIVSPRKLYSGGATNGLCQICNNNQQLKIYQLAKFEPLNEKNYDVEIEHFQKQLEKAYKLCPACNFTVKNTISQRNCSLLGKQIEEIRKSGKTLLNQSTTAKQNAIKLRNVGACIVVSAAMYAVYRFKREWIVMIEKYSMELIFAMLGSLLTMLFTNITSSKQSSTPLIIKKIKQERFSPERPQYSLHQSTATENSDTSGNLSYTSFTSPLNSTVKSDDAGSVCSELERLTSFTQIPQDLRSNQSISSPSQANRSFHNSFSNGLRKSPSAPTVFSPFAVKPALNYTFQQMHLTNTNLPSLIDSKRPILSPAKFRNPWTGKPWVMEVSSRSSSQSSGVYSRATSIDGDDTISTEQNLFRNVSHSLPSNPAIVNNWDNSMMVDNMGNINLNHNYF